MNLRDLEYVLTLAETCHFGRAADECRVSQPTLSSQIARLEQELDIVLFERQPRRVSVTEEGREFVRQARVVLDEVARLRGVAQGAGEPFEAPIALGVIPTVAPYLLPHILKPLRERHPKIQLILREEKTNILIDLLKTGRLDAAILSTPIDDPSLELSVFFREEFLAVFTRQNSRPSRGRIHLDEFSNQELLLLEEGHCMRDQIVAFCADSARGGSHRVQATSLETLRQMVQLGLGVSLMPRLALTGPFAATADLEVREFHDPKPAREIALAWRRSFPRGDEFRALAEDLHAILDEL